MEITDVRVFLQPKGDNKLKAYVTLTFEHSFVVRNVKVIEGTKGLFVAMPSERVKESCLKCGFRNVVRSRFCNQCGGSLAQAGHHEERTGDSPEERQAEHRDIAHPITMECREYIQRKVLEAYEAAKAQLGH